MSLQKPFSGSAHVYVYIYRLRVFKNLKVIFIINFVESSLIFVTSAFGKALLSIIVIMQLPGIVLPG